jgi:hypothetical protein
MKKKGIDLLEEIEGDGHEVQRLKYYILAIRLSLRKGDLIDVTDGILSRTFDENLKLHSDGYLESRVRIDRENIIAGIYYSLEGMKIGGYRKVLIAPHLAYREEGLPGLVPENAMIVAEIKVLKESII